MIDKILRQNRLRSRELRSAAEPAYKPTPIDPVPILYHLGAELPSKAEILHRRFTVVAGNLTDPAELTRLEPCVEAIQNVRRCDIEAKGRRSFIPAVYVLGFGVQSSEKYPYRSPEAQRIRDRIHAQGAILFERPPGATTGEQLRAYIQELLK